MTPKQESFHIMLVIPIVYYSHKQINIDHRNESRHVLVTSSSSDPDTENGTGNEATNSDTNNVIVMSKIDEYSIRMDQ